MLWFIFPPNSAIVATCLPLCVFVWARMQALAAEYDAKMDEVRKAHEGVLLQEAARLEQVPSAAGVGCHVDRESTWSCPLQELDTALLPLKDELARIQKGRM